MSGEFVEALNDCVERLARGESVQDCLDRYPERSEELRPLLEVSASTIRTAEQIQPDPIARQRNFLRFSQAVSEGTRCKRERVPWWRPWEFRKFTSIARPAVVGLMAIVIMATGIGATTAASSSSVPGEPLYWVKATRENVESRLPRSEESHANYQAKLAQVRGDEINKLIERGEFAEADRVIIRMTVHLKRCARHAGVTVAADPVEMPFKPSSNMGRDDADRLGKRLENDRRVFKMKVERAQRHLTSEEREQVERFLRQADLGYGLFIDATLLNSPVRRPFIIVPAPNYKTER